MVLADEDEWALADEWALVESSLAEDELDTSELSNATVCLVVAAFIGFVCAVMSLIAGSSFPLAMMVYFLTGTMFFATVLLWRAF